VKVLLVILLLLVLLALLRIKLRLSFGSELRAWLFVGAIKIDLLKKKEKKGKEKAVKKEKKPRPKPSLDEAIDLFKTALTAIKRALKRLKRSVRIDPLSLSVIIADSDPAKTAETYGYANAAVWTLMPLAEEAFDIPKPSIHLEMDFESERIRAEGELALSLRVIDILAIVFVLLVPLGKWYLRFTKAHKNDPIKAKTVETSEKTV